MFVAVVMSRAPFDHVIIVGVDGVGSAYVAPALDKVLPNLSMMSRNSREGVESLLFTLTARTVFPPVSAPAWTAILSGMSPDQSGIAVNEWPDIPLHDFVRPVATWDESERRPVTLTQLAAESGKRSAGIISWPWLKGILEHKNDVWISDCDGNDGKVMAEFEHLCGGVCPLLFFFILTMSIMQDTNTGGAVTSTLIDARSLT